MFVVNSKYVVDGQQYIELVVHGDLKTFRLSQPDGIWQEWLASGEWEDEWILGEIISELSDEYPATYWWGDDERIAL